MTYEQTAEWLAAAGEKRYRARQIRQWVFDRGAAGFSEMSNLSKKLRAFLERRATITNIDEVKRLESSDGSIKLLFRLDDGLRIESVWIPEEKRATLCVSTQVGCKLGCGFCLTGKGGFTRNLKTGEIVDQLVQARRLVPGGRVTNLVFMGMGEPLDNYDNVLKALKVLTEPENGLIGFRKVTLSTCGIAPGILRLAKDFPRVKLAVSLNATTDDKRSELMPVNKKYPLATLMSALRKWPLPKGRNITIEYVLIAGVNDSVEDAERLDKLLGSIPATVNLIPYNPCPGLPYERPSGAAVNRFRHTLKSRGREATIRESRGRDILAACGQLRDTAPA